MSLLKIWNGKPCRVCGNRQRYVSDNACVHCKQQRNKKDWQKVLVLRRHGLDSE